MDETEFTQTVGSSELVLNASFLLHQDGVLCIGA